MNDVEQKARQARVVEIECALAHIASKGENLAFDDIHIARGLEAELDGVHVSIKRMRQTPTLAVIDSEDSDRVQCVMMSAYGIPFHTVLRTETSTCPDCGASMLEDSIESKISCEACGTTGRVMYAQAGSEHANTSDKNSQYDRIPLFLRYLKQFELGAVHIPEAVLHTVTAGLFDAHMLIHAKCRQAPAIEILRRSGNGKWCTQVLRICRMLNPDRPPDIPRAVIEEVYVRFTILSAVVKTAITIKSKFLNFEFLAKQFLIMDGQHKWAEQFSFHKTKTVLIRAESRLNEICQAILASKVDGRKWFVTYAT